MSIRLRLLLLVFAVWLPAVVALAVLARSTYQRESDDALANVRQLGDSLRFVVERELDTRAVMAQTLAAAVELNGADAGRFHEEASAATQDSGSWSVLLDQTSLLASTFSSFAGQRPLPRSSRFVTGPPLAFFYKDGPVSRRPVLAVLASAPGVPAPRFNVGVGFDAAAIQSVLHHFTYPAGTVAAVIDQESRIVARSRDPAKWLGQPASEDVRRRSQAGEIGFANSITLDGVPSFSYLTGADRYGWKVVIGLPRAALQLAAQQGTFRFVALSGLLLLIGLALALYAARRISVPILALSRAAAQLGEYTVPPKLSTGVSEADDVIAALHQAGLRARKAGVVLEQRVVEAVQKAEQAQATLLEGRKHEAIGRLTGGLAHDFNNLLQTIITALQLLDRTIGDSPQRGVLEAAMRASNKAAGLIRQMLTFGRAQSLQPQPVDLRDFIIKSQELAGKAVGPRVELKAALEPDLPPLMLDPTQLELATLNLVFNASQSMPEGGHIVVVGRHARADETASLGDGRFVCLEVSDDGPGMTPDVLGKAFEPYFTTKAIGAGSGLGLSQVLSFARQSGGDARLESMPGRGTRACLILPAVEVAVIAPAVRARATRRRHGALKVLMVEDDVLLSSVVAPALEAAGHRVILCMNADDAIARLSGDEFDVLFTDVVMPGKMSGMDLVAWCRTHRPSLPAVVASGYTPQQSDGVVQVLHKPYSIDTLLMMLQQAVDAAVESQATSPA